MDSLATLPLGAFLNVLLLPAAILAIVFFWWRAGTTQSIMELLWRLFHGRQPINDTRLAAFVDQARELERFRFTFGIKVHSIADLHRFIDWQARNNLSIVQLQQASRWIDTSRHDFIVAPRRALILGIVTCLLLCVAGLISAQVMLRSDVAYLKAR